MIVKIIVFKFNSDSSKSELYRNTLTVSDGLSFEFDIIYKVLRILYPKSDGVDFSVM